MTTRQEEFVPRCKCGQATGWTRLIRGLPCAVCALRAALERAGLR